MDMIKAELDELMGKDRNLSLKEQLKKKDFYTDSKVCKYELVSVCPYSLFPNTRSDLGVCNKRHDTQYKRQFESAKDFYNEKRYIQETLKFFESLLKNIDDKINRSQLKLDSPKNIAERPVEVQVRLDNYDDEIKRLLKEAENFGAQNQVEQMENSMQEVEKIKRYKEDLIKISEQNQKSMKVCDVCGALQIINDTEQRQQAHLTGKLHTGYQTLRSENTKLKARLDDLSKMELSENMAQPGEEKSKSKKKSPSKTKKSKSKSKSKKKHKKHRSKSKSKSKDRKKSRSKSRHSKKKRHRSKDRSRHKNKKDKDKKREKDKDKDKDKNKNKDKDKDKEKDKTLENEKAQQSQPPQVQPIEQEKVLDTKIQEQNKIQTE